MAKQSIERVQARMLSYLRNTVKTASKDSTSSDDSLALSFMAIAAQELCRIAGCDEDLIYDAAGDSYKPKLE